MQGAQLFAHIQQLIAEGWVLLLDVSHWQGTIDFQKIKDLGFTGVYLKVGDPWMQGWEDPTFARNRAECRRVGLAWGGYWFFRPEYDGTRQAKRMLEIMGSDYGVLPPAMDLEAKAPLGTTRTVFRQRLRDALNTLFKYDRRIPGLYTRATFLDPNLGAETWMAIFWQWLANYDEVDYPALAISTGLYALHQKWADYDDLGQYVGVESDSVDVDVFNGTPAMFFEWARTGRFPAGVVTTDDPPYLADPHPYPPVSAPPTAWGRGTTKTNLRLRATASTAGTILLTMPPAAQVTLLDAPVNGWVHARYNGIEGYCSADPTYIYIVEA